MVKDFKMSYRKGIPFRLFAALSPSPSIKFLHSLFISHHVLFYLYFLFIRSLIKSFTHTHTYCQPHPLLVHPLSASFNSLFSQLLVPDSSGLSLTLLAG